MARRREQQLQQLTERYEGLPRDAAATSLLQALDAILTNGIGNPLQAREIQVLYVMHTYRGRPPIPAWVITLNGIPPIPHRGPAWRTEFQSGSSITSATSSMPTPASPFRDHDSSAESERTAGRLNGRAMGRFAVRPTMRTRTEAARAERFFADLIGRPHVSRRRVEPGGD